VLHVHYASGYGTLGRLSGFQPTILSVWGSDITEFARNSPIRRYLLKKNLKYPELLCATSEFLRRETEKLVMPRNPIVVTPFGVDCQIFRPRQSDAHANEFVVGTVKTLSEGYGIDRLLEAFALFQQAATRAIKLKLRIVGGGPDRRELERKAHRLGIAHLTEFTGPVPADAVPNLLAGFSVYVALSRIESFGLAVLEASAAGIPAIVSDAGGLSEVVADGVTGVVIPDGSPRLASDAMIRLLRDPDERRRMGVAGRRFVSNNFPIDKTIVTMEEVYQSITS
jgi:glycosyltransferase involved in cell wall biosynthesis